MSTRNRSLVRGFAKRERERKREEREREKERERGSVPFYWMEQRFRWSKAETPPVLKIFKSFHSLRSAVKKGGKQQNHGRIKRERERERERERADFIRPGKLAWIYLPSIKLGLKNHPFATSEKRKRMASRRIIHLPRDSRLFQVYAVYRDRIVICFFECTTRYTWMLGVCAC